MSGTFMGQGRPPLVGIKMSGGRTVQCRALVTSDALAHLSELAYGGAGKIPEGYSDITDDSTQLAVLGLSRHLIQNPQIHFRSRVYRSIDALGSHYVIAFAGTDSPGDVEEDIEQSVGVSTRQYRWAYTIGLLLKRLPASVSIVLTGHSLGGGLATAVALTSDRPAVVFNSAGLHRSNIPAVTSRPTIDAYSTDGDPLTFLQTHTRTIVLLTSVLPPPIGLPLSTTLAVMVNIGDFPKAYGDSIVVPDYARRNDSFINSMNPLTRHGIVRMETNMEQQEIVLKCR